MRRSGGRPFGSLKKPSKAALVQLDRPAQAEVVELDAVAGPEAIVRA
jgi:hypothetical protein